MNLQKNEYNVYSFVKDVLKRKFPESVHKQKIHEEGDKLNFACPYCGDSHNDVTKKRGNIYFRTNSYKCFNDGCLKWTPLSKFVSEFALKYSLPIPKLIEDKNEEKKVEVLRKGFLIEFLVNPEVSGALINFKDLQERFFLKPCKDAPEGSPIGQYVRNRHLINLPTFEQSCYYDSREDKIYIFNLDLRSGKVLGLSIRRINEDWQGPKYDIKNYSQFKKNGLINIADEKVITKIDTANNFFNILNIKFDKPIKVLEGQINAMFLENAIATTGVTKSKSVLGTLISKKNARILFDNDKAGKSETAKLIAQGYRVFMWSKLIGDLRKQYPDHRKWINDINDINDLYDFYIKVGLNPTYDEFNNIIDQYFSDSMYDLLYI